MDNKSISELIRMAKDASANAYAPYSNFPVGCVIVTKKGGVYSGCNIENITFGLTICAERAAIAKAVSVEGPEIRIEQVVVYTPTVNPISPCGACRQVIYEFGKNAEIQSYCDTESTISGSINFFLPNSPDIRLE